MLSGVRPIHPEIVGWSTAPRGQVINESLGQVPKKLVSRPARAGKGRKSSPTQSGTKQGGPSRDHWAKFAFGSGPMSTRSRISARVPRIRKAKALQFERHNDRSAWCP